VRLIKRKKVTFLLSGGGSNLYKILKKNLTSKKFITLSIISNNQVSKQIKELIKLNELKIKIYEKVSNLNTKFIGNCDVVFSVGYLKKIESKIIENYEIINLHPSLLPKYKGLMTHKRMLINNENKYGYSIHKVTKYLDDGEILSQNQQSISTSSENELSANHKRLEHQEVFKDLVNFLN
jgi:folate-dependent phosphoribosylglycinamide formyltransferase PurN|tara:strand:- start:43 stop:582 length:540 start_codon:yes stop_codon:yes gene_type:complete